MNLQVDQIPLNNNNETESIRVLTKSDKFWAKLKANKPLINCLDSVISLIVFGPLTIAFWRGTWELMDCYYVYFAGWPTYFFATSVQFSYAIMRIPLQIYLDASDALFVTKVLPKLYIYAFGIVSVIQWRSIWVLSDDYFVVVYDGPYVSVTYLKEMLIVWCAVILLLCLLRSFKNILSPPLAIDVDYRDMAFYFPTRYNIKIETVEVTMKQLDDKKDCEQAGERKSEAKPFKLWHVAVLVAFSAVLLIIITTTLYYLTTDIELDDNNETIANAERYYAPSNIRDDLNKLETLPPRPFVNIIKGPPPKSFQSLEKTAFPQLTSYRNLGYPRSIQEVLGYLSNPRPEETQNNPVYGRIQGDPFSVHKPHDPSDINLLSMGKFRFAPPVGSDNGDKNRQNKNFVQNGAHLTAAEDSIDRARPINFVLNVFPVGDEYRIVAEMPDDDGDGRNRKRNRIVEELHHRRIYPRRLAIYVNLYETNLEELEL